MASAPKPDYYRSHAKIYDEFHFPQTKVPTGIDMKIYRDFRFSATTCVFQNTLLARFRKRMFVCQYVILNDLLKFRFLIVCVECVSFAESEILYTNRVSQNFR